MLDLSVSLVVPPLSLPPTDTPPSTTWTSFSEQYFEGKFEDPFSDQREDSSDSIQSVEDQGTEGVMDGFHSSNTSSERYRNGGA